MNELRSSFWVAAWLVTSCASQSGTDARLLDVSQEPSSVDSGTLDGGADVGADVDAASETSVSPDGVSVSFNSTSVVEVCKVTNQRAGATNNLPCNYDFGGADLGVSVYDGTTTWLFFGDSKGLDSNAWTQGPDATGYFTGMNPATGLCGGGLNLVSVAGATSLQGCGLSAVFAPDVVRAPTAWSESVADFVFQPVQSPATGPSLPANSAIPGTNEVPTGAFAYAGDLYVFLQGSPWINATSPNALPVGSLSYLTRWTAPVAGAQAVTAANARRIISKVDFNLLNPSYPPPAQPTPPSPLPTPTPPPGWGVSPPMGGGFIQVAPVIAPDLAGNTYLYLFGTGTYRASHISLARLPLPTDGSALDAHVAEYLADSPGFEVWTGTSWAPYNGSNSAPLDFSDDGAADIGELSVHYYPARRIWLMMYTPTRTSTILMRWATSPTGLWSQQNVVLDMSLTPNRTLYCCQGPSTGTDSHGFPLWGCLGSQILECGAATNPVGAPRTNLYSPYMLPYLTPVSGNTYTVWYVVSSFLPYGAELMSYTIDVTP